MFSVEASALMSVLLLRHCTKKQHRIAAGESAGNISYLKMPEKALELVSLQAKKLACGPLKDVSPKQLLCVVC